MRVADLIPLLSRRKRKAAAPPTAAEEISWQTKELAGVSQQSADASRLGRLDASFLANLWTSPLIQAQWEEDQPILKRLELPQMTGGVNPGDQRALYYLAAGLQPRSILEVGTHIGCSTVNLAMAMKHVRTSEGPPRRLLSVDVVRVNHPLTRPWRRHGARWSPRAMIQQIGCDGFTFFETADSLQYLRSCRQEFDLIFLDGWHASQRVYQEMPLALNKLNRGGFIILHDYFPHLKPLWSDGSLTAGPFLALERLRREGLAVEVLEFGELPWPTKLDSHATSLAFVIAK